MSKTIKQIHQAAVDHIEQADAAGIPINLGFLARNAVEHQAAVVDVLTAAGVVEEAGEAVEQAQG